MSLSCELSAPSPLYEMYGCGEEGTDNWGSCLVDKGNRSFSCNSEIGSDWSMNMKVVHEIESIKNWSLSELNFTKYSDEEFSAFNARPIIGAFESTADTYLRWDDSLQYICEESKGLPSKVMRSCDPVVNNSPLNSYQCTLPAAEPKNSFSCTSTLPGGLNFPAALKVTSAMARHLNWPIDETGVPEFEVGREQFNSFSVHRADTSWNSAVVHSLVNGAYWLLGVK